jgi:hypothetical protein
MKDMSAGNEFANSYKHHDLYSVGGIVLHVSESMTSRKLYLVEILPSEQIAALLKVERVNTTPNATLDKKWKLEETSDEDGVTAKLQNGEIVVEVHEEIKFKQGDTWREPEYKVDVNYKFTIGDISLDVSGFGDIFDGNIDDAICSLKYTVTQDLTFTSQNRLTPANNGNGKFPSNLRRSRLTSDESKGATSIKIARVYIPIYSAAGIEMRLDLNLIITLDGLISVGLKATYENGFRIRNNMLLPIRDVDAEKEYNFFANAECGVSLTLTATFFRAPIVDIGVTAGLGLSFRTSLSVIGEEIEGTSLTNTYISRDNLISLTEKSGYEYEYSVGMCLYVFVRPRAITNNCAMGKILKAAGISLSMPQVEKVIYEKTYTNKEATQGEDDEQQAVSGDGTFAVTAYKVTLPEYTCSMLNITAYPAKVDAMDDMGGIRVYTKDAGIAIARLSGNTICIEAIGVGSTEVIIETANKRYVQECSVTVVQNSENDKN